MTVNASSFVQLIGTSANGQFFSAILAGAAGDSTGNAGDLTINTPVLLLSNGARVAASTEGSGKGGNVTINASSLVQAIGSSPNGFLSGIYALTESGSTGKGGDITITTPVLLLSDGAKVSASTLGSGKGGNVTVNAFSLVQASGTLTANSRFPSGIFTTAEEDATGKGGDITINTPVIFLRDGAQVSASTFSAGNAGNVTVNASSLVQAIGTSADLRDGSGIFAGTLPGSTGKGGDVTITTPVLLLSDGAQVSVGTYGSGKGGNVTINASSYVQVMGSSADGRHFSAIYSLADIGSTGNAGDLTIKTPELLVLNGARVSATTFGAGDAGNLRIDTDRLTVQNGGQVSADTSGTGRAGTLNVNATDFIAVIGNSADGRTPSRLFFDSVTAGNAGELTITTRRLIVRDGGQVSAATSGTGRGGTLDVTATDSIEVSGTSADGQFASGLYFDSRGAGNARGIRINTGRLVVENGGQVTVSGAGSGLSGNLDVTADSIFLGNQGSLRATTTASEGGNIRLQVADSIVLRYNSEIVAEAFGTSNGGNITIDSGSFVSGVLSENSDIVANASQGRGGTISAKAPGIFGFRQFIDHRTPESDLTASSTLGIDGSVELNTRDKLQEPLPTNFVDAAGLIDRRCTPRDRTQERSSFTITGRGGLPPSPNDPLQGEAVVTNWVSLDSDVENNTPPATTTPSSSAPRQLVEAQGWVINEKGQVVLTASAPTVTPKGEWLPGTNCNPPSAQGQ